MEPTSKRLKAAANTDDAVLPPDVIWEILLRLPVRALGRCHAACRSWRSLLAGPSFTRAYAARGPGFILALAEAGDRLDMMDASGVVLRRIRIPAEDVGVPHAGPGPLYLFPAKNHIRIMDPATGEVSTLPIHDLGRRAYDVRACYALGLVPSTGQRKVLVIRKDYRRGTVGQRCHVLTLSGDQQPRWRQSPSPPISVVADACIHDVVIQGVAYFLADDAKGHVASFDLDTEEWRPETLPGPQLIVDTFTFSYHDPQLQLAKLHHNNLVMVHSRCTTMDLWLARDLDIGLINWVKQHSIKHNFPTCSYLGSLELEGFTLLTVLEDGRIVFYYTTKERCRLMIYDPKTRAAPRALGFGGRGILGMYRGSMSCM